MNTEHRYVADAAAAINKIQYLMFSNLKYSCFYQYVTGRYKYAKMSQQSTVQCCRIFPFDLV